MVLDLELDNPSRIVRLVPAKGIPWERFGTSAQAGLWLGNASQNDRRAILLTAKQVAANGDALRISFPSVMTFFLGFDFTKQKYSVYVPEA